ncbi:MAG: hypothetical protein Fur0010_16980 [Bdellovibrio sp.]
MIEFLEKHKIKILVLVHIWAAWFSTGFHHFDEHFQIFEFMNYKLGGISASELPWEFREQMRPWFQVLIYYVIQFPFKVLGASPFFIAFVLRLITGLFGVYAFLQFSKLFDQWIQNEKIKKLAFWTFNLAWFVPYIHVRANSESLGLSLFLLGARCFLGSRKNGLIAGLFFGLSYLARSQMAIAVAPLWLWSVIFEKNERKKQILSSLAIIVMIGLGILIDSWGYGEVTFSTYHYFRANFLEGALNHFGITPWYEYFRVIISRGFAPVSLPLTLFTLAGWWHFKKHPLTWITFPFFLFHSYLGHKELRFIFPILPLCILYFPMIVEKFEKYFEKKSFKVTFKILAVMNLIVLAISISKPATNAMPFYEFMYDQKQIKELWAKDEDPYKMVGLNIRYFRPSTLEKITEIKSLDEIPVSVVASDRFIFVKTGEDYFQLKSQSNCDLLFSSYPEWILNFNIGNWIKRSRIWSLFNCQL